jgi:hypothetical protein
MALNVECHYAECHDLFFILLNDSMLSVLMRSVIILIVVLLSVVAPFASLGINLKNMFPLVIGCHFQMSRLIILPMLLQPLYVLPCQNGPTSLGRLPSGRQNKDC